MLDALVGQNATADTRQKFRKMLREGVNERETKSRCRTRGGKSLPTIDIPGMPGAQMGMVNLNEMLGKAFGGCAPNRAR